MPEIRVGARARTFFFVIFSGFVGIVSTEGCMGEVHRADSSVMGLETVTRVYSRGEMHYVYFLKTTQFSLSITTARQFTTSIRRADYNDRCLDGY